MAILHDVTVFIEGDSLAIPAPAIQTMPEGVQVFHRRDMSPPWDFYAWWRVLAISKAEPKPAVVQELQDVANGKHRGAHRRV
jgi:hypothetical protein